ncbi:MAG: murein transglycosylase A [Burkholderiaceae bacterium]
MVHHTMPTNINSASKASSNSHTMKQLLRHLAHLIFSGAIVGMLSACGSGPRRMPERTPDTPSISRTAPTAPPSAPYDAPDDTGPLPAPITQAKSRWVPVRWSQLPGFGSDDLFDAWNAWLKSCERPGPTFAPLCGQIRQLSIASDDEKRAWMTQRLQPYRVEPLQGVSEGLLTSYYEPVLDASRQRSATHTAPLYRPPASLNQRKPWYTRQEIDTLPEAQAALRDREIAYLTDPLDALVLQIQGSGRLRITEPDGSTRLVRLAFAATNDQPYRSVGSWLLQQGLVRDATWPGIKAWTLQNPQRVNEMLWVNPRMVFFREEAIAVQDNAQGPRGAQGVPLTAGRSIAVDPGSIPYGTPVWLASTGLVPLQRLVLAQDTGSAITGAVRADYYAGSGPQAGELAGRLKQPLQLWVLWPR